MTEIKFNILDDPWIPCVMKSKEFELMGIKDTLSNATEIEEISSNNPLVVVSIHRLLLAVLHRNFGPKSKGQWKNLYNAGKWDFSVLGEYFSKWKHRFELFNNAKDRFYQFDLSETVKKKTSITKLNHALSSGNNTSLFDHNWDSEVSAMDIDEVVRLLIAFQNFAVGGGVSTPYNFSHAPLVSGIVVLFKGNTLFETLMLNLIRYDKTHPFQMSDDHEDIPFWERKDKDLHEDKQGRFPIGYLDLLTWQSRRIWFIPELHNGELRVKHVLLAQGEKIREEWNEDPQMVYIIDEANKRYAIRFRPDRQVWRDAEALLRLNNPKNKTISPKAVNWISSLAKDRDISFSKRYSLETYGLCNDPSKAAKIISWNHSYIPLPIVFLEDLSLIDNIRSFIDSCEKIESTLNKTMFLFGKNFLFPEKSTLNKFQQNKVNELVQSYQLTIRYWNTVENYFYMFLDDIAKEPTYEKRLEIIRNCITDHVIQECRALLNSVRISLKDDPRAFKSIIQNFGYFYSQVKFILK
ncbi:MAG: type I-E CRISPR-associated protein Cse1/CasA [Candidatus Helarchaeota archaeon]|nr:type I-E CRISPR-associated protein Cse1/CasA [Candidatus Helarchaeota archaeon]